MLDYGQVVLATDNLFNRCRARSRTAHAPSAEPLAQLEVVANFVGDLAAIVKQYQQEEGGGRKGGGGGRGAEEQ